jgi:hypothetical protein
LSDLTLGFSTLTLGFSTSYNPVLNQFADRLLATKLSRKAVICAVMHKPTHFIHGVIRTGKHFTQVI